MSLSAALDSLLSLAREYEDDLREARLEIQRLEAENEELRNPTTVLVHDEEDLTRQLRECEEELARLKNQDRLQGGLFSFLFADKK